MRVLRKVLGAIGVLWAAATFTFLIESLLPRDRATLLLNQQSGQVVKRTASELASINKQFGFTQSLPEQYWHFITGLLHGNLGISYSSTSR